MTFNDYQLVAHSTSGQNSYQNGLTMAALGLAGESGEFCDMLKKVLFHGHPLDHDAMAKELGDILWYIAEAASWMGKSLEEIAEQNIAKLHMRYPEGFSTDASIHRTL